MFYAYSTVVCLAKLAEAREVREIEDLLPQKEEEEEEALLYHVLVQFSFCGT